MSSRKVYRRDGYVFVSDCRFRTVTVPSSVKEEDYPEEILDLIKKEKYYIKLTNN